MYVKLLPYKLKVWTLPSSKNWMLFLPWDIVNIRKLKRNIVTSPSPICPCCMLNEKENSLSIIVIRTKRPRFIAFILTQWFSSLCRSRLFQISVHKLPLPPPMASSAQLCYLLINHGDRSLSKCMWIIQETFGSNFSPEFAHLLIYLSYSWGCAYKQMGLSPCTRLSLPCQAPEYSNTALHPSCRRSSDTREGTEWCDTCCFEIRLLCISHKILGSILTGKQPAEKLKNQGENWATEVAF